MRVLVVTRLIDRSECGVYRGLHAAGHSVDILCNPQAAHRKELLDSGLSVSLLDVRNRLDLRAIRILRRLIEADNYDIVYAPDNSTLSASLFAARNSPVRVVGYRGTIGHLSRLDPASRWTYLNPRIDGIVCISNAVRRFLRDRMHVPESRLTTIYKGHDPAWYEWPEPASLAACGIPPDAFVVGLAGRVRPVKGVVYLLEAIRELIPDFPNLHLLVIGEVCDRKAARLAGDTDLEPHVHLTGFRDDAARLVGQCDVFVMPSIAREGLCRAVLEALAQEVPAIVSKVGGLPETVVDGKSGIIVPPCDTHALAAAIRYFAEAPERCDEFGRNALERVRNTFDIRETVRRMADLFEGLCGESRGASGTPVRH